MTLVGCSRQPPPPQVAGTSCASPNPLACFMAVGLPMPIEISFRSNSARPIPTHDKTAARAEAITRPRNSTGGGAAGYRAPAIRRTSAFIARYCASCCILVTPNQREADKLRRAEGGRMFDVYLNEKRDRLLVVAKGRSVPVIENSGRWRKKKELSLLVTRSSRPCREKVSIGADWPNIEGATRRQVSHRSFRLAVVRRGVGPVFAVTRIADSNRTSRLVRAVPTCDIEDEHRRSGCTCRADENAI